MNLIEFFHEHWFLAFFVLLAVHSIVYAIVFRLPNRILRTIKVVSKGWPPEHLDADGDFKPEPESNE